MRQFGKRLENLERATSLGRVRWYFRWSSQDPEETFERWKASLIERGAPLQAGDDVRCVVFNDPTGGHANSDRMLRAPSYPSEPRFVA